MGDILDDVAGLIARVAQLERERSRITALEAPLVWIPVAFDVNWANYNPFQQCQYSLDEIGNVRLRGLAFGSTGAISSVCTLPAGFRPAAQELHACSSAVGVQRVDTLVNGTVMPGAAIGAGGYLSLTGISFVAA